MKTKRLTKIILSLTIACQSTLALAEAPPPQIKPVASFANCSELLAHAKSGQFEEKLIQSAQTPDEILAVMNESNLISGKSARAALFATLANYGFKLEPDREKKTSTLFRISREAKTIVTLSDEQWSKFAIDFLRHLALVVGANPEVKKAAAQVAHLQITRLAQAIEKSDRRREFVLWVKALAVATTVDLAKAALIENFHPRSGYLRETITTLSTFLGFAFGMILTTHLVPDSASNWVSAIEAVGCFAAAGISSFVARALSVPDRLFALKRGGAALNNYEAQWSNDSYYQIMKRILAENKKNSYLSLEPRESALGLAEFRAIPDFKELTAVQIAYVGQVDLLEIQAEAASAEITLNSLETDNELRDRVKRAAEAVLAQNGSHEATSHFVSEMQNYILALEMQTLLINDQVKAMSTTVNKLRADYFELKQRASRAAPNDAAAQQLLGAMQSELGGLENLRIQRQVQNQMIAELQAHLADLENIASQVINFVDPSVAQTQAEETLLKIEKFISLRK